MKLAAITIAAALLGGCAPPGMTRTDVWTPTATDGDGNISYNGSYYGDVVASRTMGCPTAAQAIAGEVRTCTPIEKGERALVTGATQDRAFVHIGIYFKGDYWVPASAMLLRPR